MILEFPIIDFNICAGHKTPTHFAVFFCVYPLYFISCLCLWISLNPSLPWFIALLLSYSSHSRLVHLFLPSLFSRLHWFPSSFPYLSLPYPLNHKVELNTRPYPRCVRHLAGLYPHHTYNFNGPILVMAIVKRPINEGKAARVLWRPSRARLTFPRL